jgi:hypothetical protein
MKTNCTVRLVQQLGYKLDDRGIGVRFPKVATNFYLYHFVQIGHGDQPATYAMGSECCLAGDKAGEA